MALVVKNPSASTGVVRDTDSISGSGRSPGGANGTPLQYSCLENPMDRGAWWAIVHGVAESNTTAATEQVGTMKSAWLSESSCGSSPLHSFPILEGFLGKTLIWPVFPFPKSYSWRTPLSMCDFQHHSVLWSDQIKSVELAVLLYLLVPFVGWEDLRPSVISNLFDALLFSTLFIQFPV